MPGEFDEVQLYFNRLPNRAAVVFEISINVKLEHSKNAPLPMLVTEFGIITDIKLEQRWNAYAPMSVTELPIVRDVKLEHP